MSPPPETKPKTSTFTVLGAVLFPIGFLPLLFVSSISIPVYLQYVLSGLALVAMIATPIMGFLGIRQIRSSQGLISGIRLAVVLTIFYPIIALDLLLFMIGYSLLGQRTTSSLIPLAWLVLVILIDYFIVRVVWNKAIL